MPGIAGIIRKRPYDAIDTDLDAMVGALRHDRQSRAGKYVDEVAGLRVGWVCHPGSYSDCMPLVAENDEVVIVFYGEHYPTREQVSRLREAGVDTTARNASYLLGLYEVYGDRFYTELNGWFCGVLLDRRRKTLTVFNDRYAMGRLYYHETDEEFIFSSEAKSLLRVRPALRRLSTDAVAELLRYNCAIGDRSLFAGVHQLPHASAWSFNNGVRASKRRYFEFREWEGQQKLEAAEFYGRWAETVSEIVPKYAADGGPVALSLTAGLDTRLILAALGERNRDHAAYTFGGAWGELFDVSIARKAASVYRQRFNAIRINDTFLDRFGDYATEAVRISDGCHDAFGAHDVFFNEVARDIAPVRLTGKFGSEIVRIRRLVGTENYAPGVLRQDLHGMVGRLPNFQASKPDANHLTRVVTEEVSWHEYGRVAVEQAYLTMRTPYMDNALVKLMFQSPEGSRAAGDLQERYVKEHAPEFATFITNLGRFSSRSALLTKLAYYPFWALFKMEYIYLMATPHWLTRLDRLAGALHPERLFGGRQKWEGYRIWINTHFGEFIQDTLLNPQAAYTEYFDYATMARMVRQHVAGTHNHLLPINKALTLQLIHSALLTPATGTSQPIAYHAASPVFAMEGQ